MERGRVYNLQPINGFDELLINEVKVKGIDLRIYSLLAHSQWYKSFLNYLLKSRGEEPEYKEEENWIKEVEENWRTRDRGELKK